jgi:sugar phosphate isomerase/epimerase
MTAYGKLTLGFSNPTLRIDQDAVEILRSGKVSHMEIRIDDIDRTSPIYQQAYIALLSSMREEFGISLSAHSYAGVNLAEKVTRIRELCVELFTVQVDFCERIGARWLTVHAGTCGFSASDPRKAQRIELAAESLRSILLNTEGSPVQLALENVERKPDRYHKTFLGDCLAEMKQLQALAPIRTGFLFDTGHANLNPEREVTFLLDGLLDKLLGFHVHANSGDTDSHDAVTAPWLTGRAPLFERIFEVGARGFPLVVEHHDMAQTQRSLEVLIAMSGQWDTGRSSST